MSLERFSQIIFSVGKIVILVLVLAMLFYIFRPKVLEYRGLERRKAEREHALKQAEEQLKVLRTNQDRFQNDREFVERIAHDLGLAKTNEVLFKIAPEENTLTPLPPGESVLPPAALSTNRPIQTVVRPRHRTPPAATTNRPPASRRTR